MNKFVKVEQLERFLEKCVGLFVKKDGEKVLSDNNYTTEEKTKLEGLENYTLPKAQADVLGGIMVGANLTISDEGILSANAQAVDLEPYAKTVDVASTYETKENATATYATIASLDNYALKTDVVGAVKYKGSVDNYGDLPSEAETGWMYNIRTASEENGIKAGDNVVYNGTEWDNYSGMVTIETATDADIDAMFG